MLKINLNEVSDRYNSMKNIWNKKDLWHYHTYLNIKKYLIFCHTKFLKSTKLILNAGSSGNDYCIPIEQIHLDIAWEKIKYLPNSVCANVCDIPFKDQYFDASICVGSVLNYCDAMLAIKEISRVTKTGGYIVLEFETSKSFEYLDLPCFNKNIDVATTFYNGSEEKVYVYSQDYLYNILKIYSLEVKHKKMFHIISPLAYKITKSENFSYVFSYADIALAQIPFINSFCSNVILICQKTF